jgi:hypothetical protein
MFMVNHFLSISNAMAALFLLCGVLSCQDELSSANEESAPVSEGDWYRPAVGVAWQWQLLGDLNTSYDVEIYDIDLFDVSPETISLLQRSRTKVICYFSAGSWEDWRDDAESFPESTLGNTLDGWPNEKWLDIRSGDIKAIMLKRLDVAVAKGCDGVEPDNMDAYQNDSGFQLSSEDQLSYNIFIANQAHEKGLSVGLKNDLDQIDDLVSYYDFSVNEQCFEYDECDTLAPFIQAGKPVLNAEYEEILIEDATERTKVCEEARASQLSTLILPLNLDDSFRYDCIE